MTVGIGMHMDRIEIHLDSGGGFQGAASSGRADACEGLSSFHSRRGVMMSRARAAVLTVSPNPREPLARRRTPHLDRKCRNTWAAGPRPERISPNRRAVGG